MLDISNKSQIINSSFDISNIFIDFLHEMALTVSGYSGGEPFMLKRENYMRRIRPFIGNDLIKVITGIRRCGKSVMLSLIQQEIKASGVSDEHFIMINFENMSSANLTSAETLREEILMRVESIPGKVYLFLDEIQEVDRWEQCINSLRIELDCDIYITGSNATLLSGELATYLAGRYVEFVIYPFSFSEFLAAFSTEGAPPEIHESFRKYLKLGGMPYLHNLHFEEEPVAQYLRDVYNSVVLKDIVKRHRIRDIDLLERIIAYLTANIGTEISANSISKFFRSEGRVVSTETILNYIKACEDSFLFNRIRRQDVQGKRILASNEKFYIADHGIREAIFGGNTKDIQLVLENIVCMELLRRGYQVTVGKSADKEIDFICEKQSEKMYLQVTYLLASDDTIKREFGVFKYVSDNYPKYVLSMDELNMSRDGIRHMNIRDFLLETHDN